MGMTPVALFQDGGPLLIQSREVGVADTCGWYQLVLRRQAFEKARSAQLLPVREGTGSQVAQNRAIEVEDTCVWIPKRSRFDLGDTHSSVCTDRSVMLD